MLDYCRVTAQGYVPAEEEPGETCAEVLGVPREQDAATEVLLGLLKKALMGKEEAEAASSMGKAKKVVIKLSVRCYSRKRIGRIFGDYPPRKESRRK